MWKILIVLIFTVSCAGHDRTKYKSYDKKQGGYQDKILDEQLRIVSFKANSYTKRKLATKFARLRAIEICTEQNFKLAHLLDTFDKTTSKTVTRSTSSGYPSYYYGMSPFYNRFSGFGYGFGYSTQSGSSWQETLHFPEVEVIFECANDVYEPKLELREVTAEEMKHLVKDLRGALQVEKIPAGSPNQRSFKTGDIILRGGDERVQQIYQLLALFRKSKNHHIPVEVMRDGKMIQGLKLKGSDATADMLRAQAAIIKSACKFEDVKSRSICKKPGSASSHASGNP